VAQGIGIDAALRPDVVETIALKVVKKIEKIVDEDSKVYVFTSAERRIDVESFASITHRGNGTRLISDKKGGNVTAKIMKDTYKWECKESLYTTTSAYNMNEVEKQVHKLLFENEMSIWLRNGAGGVHLDKEGKMLTKFSLSIIHGSCEGLSFASTHPRKLLE
jgi:predicted transcriptional regulator